MAVEDTSAAPVGTDTPRPTGKAARRAIARRRWRTAGGGFHAFLQCALAFAFTAALSAIFFRFNPDLDITLPFARGVLDDGTRAQIASLDAPLEITAVVERNHFGAARVRRLLRAIRLAAHAYGRDIHTERIDPHRDVARAAALLETSEARVNSLFFKSGDRSLAVPVERLFDYAIDPDTGKSTPTSFRGEAVCAAAMASVTSARVPVAYALAGHGERDFSDYDPLVGYSTFAREIRRQGYDLRTLRLVSSDGVPDDCDVLVVAGPRDELVDGEAARISSYIAKGGRMLLLSDRGRTSGLEPLLARYGITFRPLTAVSPRTLTGYEVVVTSFPDHPSVHGMRNSAAVFTSPQVLGIGAGDGGIHLEEFVKTTPIACAPENSWGESSPDAFPRHFDPGADAIGELPLAAAASRGTSATDIDLKESRIVVIGDSHFGSNAALERGRNGNRDLLLNALDWLSGSAAADAFAPAADPRRPDLTRENWTLFLVLSVGVFPGAALLLSALYVAARNRRTSPRRQQDSRD